jgi:hypothetical protein
MDFAFGFEEVGHEDGLEGTTMNEPCQRGAP